MTNRKSHTTFRLVPKSTTLNDLERPIRTLLQKRCVFRSTCTTKIGMKINQYYHVKCTPVSGCMSRMRIYAEVPCAGGVKRQWPGSGSRQRQFSVFIRWLIFFVNFRYEASRQRYYTAIRSPSSAFQ